MVISTLACAVSLLFARPAVGQACQSARPTDPGGSAGLGYGGAEVAFFDSPSGRARVHYALTGTHSPPAVSTDQVGVPDAVLVAAEAADAALEKFADLEYSAPLADGDSPCASNGGSDAVDVYLLHFAAADGQAVVDHCLPGSPQRCAGFVLVENDFRGGGYANITEGLRTVVPHELFHLVQNAYDTDVERWWAEGSAQWAAKQVYPELTDLERFLPAYFGNPWRPLNVPPAGVITSFLYATAIWPVFLHERFDAALVREIYEALDGSQASVLPKTDAVLAARGTSLAEQFSWFAAYNAATAERAPDSAGYAHAVDYPLVELEPFEVADGATLDEISSGLGAFYYSVQSAEPLELSLEADPERVQALLVPVIDGKAEVQGATPLPATLEGEAIVVVAGQSLARTDAPFTLRASAQGDEAEEPDDAENPSPGAPGSSGCSLTACAAPKADDASALLGFVITLLGGWRARKRTRKDV
jgi:hypothetical protein